VRPTGLPRAKPAASTLHEPSRRELLAGGLLAPLGLAATLAGCAGTPAAAPPLPRPAVGRIERLELPPSRHIAARPVDVWLPPGFEPGRPHAVLYMHDGQMLFDAGISWNRQSWELPATAARLMAQRLTREFIVVGIWNAGPGRFREYFPNGFVPHVPPGPARETLLGRGLQGQSLSDAYLRFVVEELKPFVDRRYGTLSGPADTVVAGSSMGGLISVYALCEYPQVFGGAAALSTHWIGGYERNRELPDAALAYLRQKLPPPGRHRLYMDRGTTELDARYDEAQPRIDALLQERGFGPPLFVSRVFEGEGHNERAWARRLEMPLRHLLGA
jgi:enterochelin esterase-like enzyme